MLHAASSSPPIKPEPIDAASIKRPDFKKDVEDILDDMGKYNKYEFNPKDKGGRKRPFDKCHIIPFGFMKKMIDEYSHDNFKSDIMEEFILDLAKMHTTAAFFSALPDTTQKEIGRLAKKYYDNAKSAFEVGDLLMLAKTLFNMPSNLYPGDHDNNNDIGNNIDPPKEGIGKTRTKEASKVAKELFNKYKPYGLTEKSDGKLNMAKTSDKPIGDDTGDYVSI